MMDGIKQRFMHRKTRRGWELRSGFKRAAGGAIIIAACVGASAQTTTTYTGTILDLSLAPVTSGQITFTLAPSTDSTLSGTGRFVPFTITCPINSDGTFSAQGGGACTVTRNTVLSPTGTSYRICIQPQFVTPGSCFYDYATTSTKDISTPAPTLSTGPINYAVSDASAMKYQGAYASGKSYALNDVVLSAGVTYVSLVANNQNNTPLTSPSVWQALGSGSSAFPANLSAVKTDSSGVPSQANAIPYSAIAGLSTVGHTGQASDIIGLGISPTILPGFTTNIPFTEGTGTVAHDLSANHNDCTFGSGPNAPIWIVGGISHLNGLTTSGFCSTPASTTTTDNTLENARSITWCGYIRPYLGNSPIPGYDTLVGSSNVNDRTLGLFGGQILRLIGFPNMYSQTSGLGAGTYTSTPAMGYHCITGTSGSTTDSTLDRLYIDDQETGNYGNQVATWDTRVAGHYMSVGQAGFGGAISNNDTTYVLGYPTVITPAQVANNWHALQNLAFYQRGIGLPPSKNFLQSNQLVCNGDSLQHGTPGGVTPPCDHASFPGQLGTTFLISNIAVAGTTVRSHVAASAVLDAPHFSPATQYNFDMEDGGINDLNIGGSSNAQVLADRIQWAANARAIGFTPFWITLISSIGQDANIQAVNAALRINSTALGITLIDVAEDKCLGETGAYANPAGCASFQSDGLHESQAGADAIRQIMANVINYKTGSTIANPTLITASTHPIAYGEGYTQATPSGSTTALTLPSCVGLSNTTPYVVYHAEIAHTVTVVPAGSETLNGGSSAVTVPALGRTTFVAYALTPTTTTAGCYWVSF